MKKRKRGSPGDVSSQQNRKDQRTLQHSGVKASRLTRSQSATGDVVLSHFHEMIGEALLGSCKPGPRWLRAVPGGLWAQQDFNYCGRPEAAE